MTRRALAAVVSLGVAALVLASGAAWILNTQVSNRADGSLVVATKDFGTYHPGQEAVQLRGALQGVRNGRRACFFLENQMSGGADGRAYFVFPEGYSVSRSLVVLNATGEAVARIGDTVSVVTNANNLMLMQSAAGCPTGYTVGVYQIMQV